MKLTGFTPLINGQQLSHVFPTREQAINHATHRCKAIGLQAVIDAQFMDEEVPKEIMEELGKYIDPADLP